MGEISEYYREHDDFIPDKKTIFTNKPDWFIDDGTVWCTAKGKWMRVQDMTTIHILNTIRAWQGLGKTEPPKNYLGGKKKWMDILTKELMRRDSKNK